ncbi:ATP-binding cassette, subfamily B, MsbA [Caloranaerobacter azorensis DSM 13643]|uniref:ATP-binding cassette, subfamily B, MsbA n=1 Tax=Caloranaerobacter azorensis DSM 13643 TaxID=1121264 RepID=A0A1M5S1H3_9FIRM|nr:ABC transporter ATP-binding protein [Caloranaerobacter azorensis]SHH32304.1 ATP-binding cassette, subfamily B, MsbA [Caloranaerobacter azorensis DSM 13643]
MSSSSTLSKVLKIFKLCREFWGKAIVLAITLVLTSFLSAYPIKYIEKIINIATSSAQDKVKAFFLAGCVYLLLHVLNIIFRALFEYLNVYLETQIGHKIRIELFSKLQKIPYRVYVENNTSDLMVRLIEDSKITVSGMLKPLTFIIRDILIFIFGFYYMSRIDLQITLIMVPIGIVLSLQAIKTGPKINKLAEDERQANSLLWGKFSEGIKGIKEIKSYCQEKRFSEEVSKKSINMNKKILSLQKFVIITSNINSAFFMGIIAFIMIFGGYKVSIGTLSIGGLTAIMMYNGLLIDPMINFFSFYQQMQQVFVSSDKIFSILEEKEENSGEIHYKYTFENKLEIKELTFKYNDKIALKNISLNIFKGEKVAFVGYSGSGKSTLCKLLIRFYEPDKGQIIIDGYDIKNISLNNLRKIFGIVFQDTFLFTGTLRENILFSNPQATEEELNEALRIAGVDSFLEKLPFGLDTPVGENGFNLSGGERQRVSIARTILRNPDIIILDESTSSLDPITTSKVIKRIVKKYENRTIIFTAHKLTTISKLCDKIYVFKDGEIVEEGIHDELINRDTLYRKIYNAQFLKSS